MTKFSKTVLTDTLLLSSLYTYADEEKGDYILMIDTGNGKVESFILDGAENASFTICDENRNLIYSGEPEINKFEISKTISLQGYPSGIYFLEIIENGKVAKHQIKVTAKKEKTLQLDESLNQIPAFSL